MEQRYSDMPARSDAAARQNPLVATQAFPADEHVPDPKAAFAVCPRASRVPDPECAETGKNRPSHRGCVDFSDPGRAGKQGMAAEVVQGEGIAGQFECAGLRKSCGE